MTRSPEGLDRRVADRFEQLALVSARYAAWCRCAAVVILGLWLAWVIPAPRVYYYELLLAVFTVLGWINFHVSRRRSTEHWLIFVFAFIDMGLVTFAILSENPFARDPLPVALHYRLDAFVFFFLMFSGVLHSYSPRLVLWSGVSIALWWAGALALAVNAPGVVTEFDLPGFGEMSHLRSLERAQAPDFIDVIRRVQEALVALLVAGIASFAVARSRRLVLESVRAERARENLARYFSPDVAAELASKDHDLGAARRQHAAVLFADIVGFTRLSESLGPEGTIALLREWHGRLGDIVFRNGGTLDKYIGDGLMATFGTPHPRADDATRALEAALEMAAAARRSGAAPEGAPVAGSPGGPGGPPGSSPSPLPDGVPPVRIGIGLHYGPVVLGDIGNERRLEFAVLGDTVNVASRLEGLTREVGTDLVASRELVARVREEGGPRRPTRFPRGAKPPGPRRARRGVRAWGRMTAGFPSDSGPPSWFARAKTTGFRVGGRLSAGEDRLRRTPAVAGQGVPAIARGARPPIDAASGSAPAPPFPRVGAGTGVSKA